MLLMNVNFRIIFGLNNMCSEVFFMMMISVIFHAFAFLHKQIDELLGNPDSIFNVAGTPSDENCQVHL